MIFTINYLNKDNSKKHFKDILEEYQKHLEFFRQSIESETKPEKNRYLNKNFNFICSLPKEIRDKKQNVKNKDAKIIG